jgi:hypothetical protein
MRWCVYDEVNNKDVWKGKKTIVGMKGYAFLSFNLYS